MLIDYFIALIDYLLREFKPYLRVWFFFVSILSCYSSSKLSIFLLIVHGDSIDYSYTITTINVETFYFKTHLSTKIKQMFYFNNFIVTIMWSDLDVEVNYNCDKELR